MVLTFDLHNRHTLCDPTPVTPTSPVSLDIQHQDDLLDRSVVKALVAVLAPDFGTPASFQHIVVLQTPSITAKTKCRLRSLSKANHFRALVQRPAHPEDFDMHRLKTSVLR